MLFYNLININNNVFQLYSPLEQFENVSIFYIFSISNLYIMFCLIFLFLIITSFLKNPKVYTLSAWHLLFLTIIEQLSILIIRNLGVRVGQFYFIWLFFVFIYISSVNLIGLIPYSFTVSSHIIVTFTISFIFFIAFNLRAIVSLMFKYFRVFLPQNAPIFISPFLIIIELISYIARMFSLAIRLFANIIAGHTLLKILIFFAFLLISKLAQYGWLALIIGAMPFLLVYIITFLEIAIAFLQAYVFTVLLCLYIRDVYFAH